MKNSRRRNPINLSAGGIAGIVAVIGAGASLAAAYQWWKKNRDSLIPKSAAEKQVDSLYGPAQTWKANPVYNTPGTTNYYPTLPASYAPGTSPLQMPIPPGKIEATMLKTVSADFLGPADYAKKGVTSASDVYDAATASMFGLGGFGSARFKAVPQRRIKIYRKG